MSDASGFVDSQVAFLYASQTGNAESISYSMYEAAVKRGFQAKWHVLDDHEKIGFNDVRTAVFVVSTTGDGDPPDNSARFWRVLRKATRAKANAYSHLRFAILGLGDTNYSNFCNTAQRLDKQLLEAGATAFYPKGLADDGTGLEDVVEAWIEGLWPALARVAQCSSSEQLEPEATKASESATKTSDAVVVAEPRELVADLASLTLSSGTHQPLVLDFQAMEALKAITGAPRLASAVCTMEYTAAATATTAQPTTWPPWYEGMAAEEASLAPFLATVQSTTQLTTPEALKRTLLVELLLSNTELGSWQAGDSFNVYAPNDERLVAALLGRLVVDSDRLRQPVVLRKRDEAIELPAHLARFATTPASPLDILRWTCDVCAAPRKQLLRALAEHCTEAQDRDRLLFLSSRQGAAAFDNLRRQAPTTLDLLCAFPSCCLPIERLLELLPPLAPRAYSICNAPNTDTATWRFAFNVIEYCIEAAAGHSLQRQGVCTPWLERLPQGSRILVARRRNANSFRLPPLAESRRPVVMVGPGTGVAPFVGFLEQRAQELSKIGDAAPLMWLFFGCRSRANDFLFRAQLEQCHADGVLSRLSTCFSRDVSASPKYVQDAMVQHEAELMDLMITQDALLFVCGDAKGMGKDVNEALADMLCRYSLEHPEHFDQGHLSKVQALQLLARWSAERRYLRDLWA
ncbi:hypothetical protein GGI20_004024 [Coemansia sp. BCRC 34301]|nr:hypothetical protein GGI20_004024 [Coemansia sp. BCRC 34301]